MGSSRLVSTRTMKCVGWLIVATVLASFVNSSANYDDRTGGTELKYVGKSHAIDIFSKYNGESEVESSEYSRERRDVKKNGKNKKTSNKIRKEKKGKKENKNTKVKKDNRARKNRKVKSKKKDKKTRKVKRGKKGNKNSNMKRRKK